MALGASLGVGVVVVEVSIAHGLCVLQLIVNSSVWSQWFVSCLPHHSSLIEQSVRIEDSSSCFRCPLFGFGSGDFV